MNDAQDMWVWAPWFNGPRLVEATVKDVTQYAEDNPEHFLFYAELTPGN